MLDLLQNAALGMRRSQLSPRATRPNVPAPARALTKDFIIAGSSQEAALLPRRSSFRS